MRAAVWMSLLATVAAASLASGGTYYEVTTLDVPFGSPGTSTATGVNNLGAVVGNYAGPDGDYNGPYPHAFQWLNGIWGRITNATGIWGLNDAGLAVGVMPGGDGTGLLHDIHTGVQTGFHVPGTYYTRIEGINNAGQVVGCWYHGTGSGAFLGPFSHPELAQTWNHPWVNHRNESATAHGVDNLGRICGFVDAPYEVEPDKPYYIGGFITTDPGSSGAFIQVNPGSWSHVTASNTNGVMVGYYSTNGWYSGFVGKAGVMEPFLIELPRVVSTEIWDVNDLGWLVGGYVQLNELDQPVRHGFLAMPKAPKPIPLEMRRARKQLVFTWYSKAFVLQCAPDVRGAFTNIPGATSPWTNSIAGDQLYFRLIAE